ncbi:hypothetical protein [uncultured Thiocystis sp.]|uniref:hypothetical protein n=1 Tax=uncultured Thiocystis sp. TaxID=1202134 RepID=UPI0025ECDB05|nr:hypothetical protein [uncultured Thiocystis sp.]
MQLRTTGGRNADGVYAIRFFTNQELREVYKRGREAGQLLSGTNSAFAGNVIFRVPSNGAYQVIFDPHRRRYEISPPVEEFDRIESMQWNGFVHDREGAFECFDGRRMRPAERWDEWVPAHELHRNADGSWSITLPLTTKGGHEGDGVYQTLISANHNSDHGFSAILNQPGRLAGGNGYDSRVGHIEETALIFRVPRNGDYTLTVWPEDYRFEIKPPVSFFQVEEYQIDGDVVADPWNPLAPEHDMDSGEDGLWHKTLNLKTTGAAGTGIYTMNFSIDGSWALDSIGTGGHWGKTWHSAPQESNIHFRVPADGAYRVTLNPADGIYWFDPPVEPAINVETLAIAGDFIEFAADGAQGWNPLDPMHHMTPAGDGVFSKDLRLKAGRAYQYKYAANGAGWFWAFADYPYDGYRRLATHGNPPAMTFECPRDGIYRFRANVITGEYGVELIQHL